MEKFATATATKKLAENNPALQYTPFAQTQIMLSQAGFGTYRVHISMDEHKRALEHALLNGVNVIDTSSNYADGGAEELIGTTLSKLIKKKQLTREQVFIISKGGYIQGYNLQQSQILKQQGKVLPELVEYSKGVEHCIHPDFLADQITQSLDRLQLESLDCYLLHNPEYYLLWAQKQNLDIEKARLEYYRRIEQAFMHLEIEVQNGRIKSYGVSSNTFPVEETRYDFSSLSQMWHIASSLRTDHHFKAIQCPINLLESQAATEVNQENGLTVLQFAQSKNLSLFSNRPLNAFEDNHLKRLIHLQTSETFEKTKLLQLFDRVINMEKSFLSDHFPTLHAEQEDQKKISSLITTGSYLAGNWEKLGPYWQWLEAQAHFVTEQISYTVQLINEVPDKTQETIAWLDDYVPLMNDVLGMLTLAYGNKAVEVNSAVYERFINKFPKKWGIKNLQHLALRALRSTEGITTILVGMRNTAYVDDVLTELKVRAQKEPDLW